MAKIVKPLSFLQIKNAKPKEKTYKLSDGGGLYLEVTPAGSKLWRMKYRQANGKENRLSFGAFPDVLPESARQQRDAARKLKAADIDPADARKEKKLVAKEKAGNTFEKIAREWHNNRLGAWRESTAKDTIQRLEKDIFPSIGALPVGEITHKQVISALRKIEDRGAKEVARRLKATCARIFSYANQNGIVNRNPAADLKDVLKPVKAGHFASISPDELPAFLFAMKKNSARLYNPTWIAMRLMLLLFLRTSELIEAPWSEINLEKGEWIIPWNRMKRGKLAVNPDTTDHHVCLSLQAWELLRELRTFTGGNKWLFPNQRDHEKPMSNGALLAALRRMGYQNKMTGHGFRALAMSTIKERLGYRHEVVDRQLAHAQKDKVASAYDRATFLGERKKMMQDWADYIDVIESGRKVINVPFQVA